MTNQSATFTQVPRSLMNPTPGEQALYDHDAVKDLQFAGKDIAGANKLLDEAGIVDTDGDVTKLVPWLQEVGVAGVLPLERQAKVDGMALRRQFPTLRMIGHFDKLTMHRGEAAMRAEFERLEPLMKSGGFIPSVDHQTPPGVSLEAYRLYLRLLEEYTRC